MLALTMCQWLVGTHGTRLDSHMWPCRVSAVLTCSLCHHGYLKSLKGVPTSVLQVGQPNVSGNTATIPCTFLAPFSFSCMVCCSTNLSVPVGLAGSGYLSSTNGSSVSVSLQGLTSGQMYYCKAAATNTNSNNCAGPVVGGVKVFFSFMTSPVPITTSPPSMSTSLLREYCITCLAYVCFVCVCVCVCVWFAAMIFALATNPSYWLLCVCVVGGGGRSAFIVIPA